MSNYLKDLEDSRLLFRTFCDGLMYGMFFYHGETLHRVTSIEELNETVNGVYLINECKPCLRSMGSMTEEEKADLEAYSKQELDRYADNVLNSANKDTIRYSQIALIYTDIDWYNKNHFDYRGLIPMGLALEAPNNMYNT